MSQSAAFPRPDPEVEALPIVVPTHVCPECPFAGGPHFFQSDEDAARFRAWIEEQGFLPECILFTVARYRGTLPFSPHTLTCCHAYAHDHWRTNMHLRLSLAQERLTFVETEGMQTFRESKLLLAHPLWVGSMCEVPEEYARAIDAWAATREAKPRQEDKR